jgi:predicted dehydrogenase
MPKKYRVAAIGFAHVHMASNLREFAECGDRVEFVAVADLKPDVPTLSEDKGTRIFQMKDAVERYGLKKYDDYETLLDENKIDIALVCSENAWHPEVLETILRRGICAVVEKPLAMSMEGALRVARAAREGGAKVITNWPSAWFPAVRTAKKLLDSGEIGRLFKFYYRNFDSQGPFSYGQNLSAKEKSREWWYRAEMGGGAMMDYCCYGACMSSWFIGQTPEAAYGLMANFDSQYGSADDYAAVTVRFPGAVAQLEGSWTTVNSGVPNGPLLYGLEGTIVARQNGNVEIYKKRHTETPDRIVNEPLPEDRETLAKETLYHLDSGESLFPMLDLPLNMAAVSILDAGVRSAKSGKMELVKNSVWGVGDE